MKNFFSLTLTSKVESWKNLSKINLFSSGTPEIFSEKKKLVKVFPPNHLSARYLYDVEATKNVRKLIINALNHKRFRQKHKSY